jgi:hypothetical protein
MLQQPSNREKTLFLNSIPIIVTLRFSFSAPVCVCVCAAALHYNINNIAFIHLIEGYIFPTVVVVVVKKGFRTTHTHTQISLSFLINLGISCLIMAAHVRHKAKGCPFDTLTPPSPLSLSLSPKPQKRRAGDEGLLVHLIECCRKVA